MSSKKPSKVYTKDSIIPGIGKGLFASVNIKKGSIIVEFKGKLRKPNEKLNDSRSNIYFHDEYVLECPTNDLASFANDAINFTRSRRKLMETLTSNEPFYKKHLNAKVNADIKINNNLHRAFLIAINDINVNEEIFTHYGFMYWFKQEISEVGFLQEDEIEENGFPEKIFEYPAFLSYIKDFFPNYESHEIKPYRDAYDFIIKMKDGNYYVLMIENFANQIQKVPINKVNDFLLNKIQEEK
jgi:hypothetical protein